MAPRIPREPWHGYLSPGELEVLKAAHFGRGCVDPDDATKPLTAAQTKTVASKIASEAKARWERDNPSAAKDAAPTKKSTKKSTKKAKKK